MASSTADWSGAVLAEKLSGLERNFHDHVEHSASRSDLLETRLGEIARTSQQQALSLQEIVVGQKTTEKLLRTFLTVAGLMFAACSTVAAIWRLTSP